MFDIFIANSNGNLKQKFLYACEVKNLSLYETVCWAAKNSSTELFWVVTDSVDYEDFDFSYEPEWHQRDHLHVWPSNNQTLGGETLLVNRRSWLKQQPQSLLDYQPFTQHTEALKSSSAETVFVWQTNFSGKSSKNSLRYIGDRTGMLEKTLRRVNSKYIWITSDTVDYTDFNFGWLPNWGEHDYIHVWPTNNQTTGGDTYLIPVDTIDADLKSIEHYEKIVWHNSKLKTKQPIPVVIWDSGHNQDNISKIETQVNNVIKLRQIGDRKSMILKTLRAVGSKNFWIVADYIDYENFDFDWNPGWSEENQLHVWSSKKQGQHGETMWVPGKKLFEQIDQIESLETYKTVNWHTEKTISVEHDEVFIWNTNANKNNLNNLQTKFPNAKVLRYAGNHFSMMQKTLRNCEKKNFWVFSDTIDYTDFDFDWHPDWSEDAQLHVWTTNGSNRNGDTFWVPVAELKKQIDNLECLSQFNSVKWHHRQTYTLDTHPKVLWSNKNKSQLSKELVDDTVVLRKLGTRLGMIEKSIRHTSGRFAWVLDDETDYANFDFGWTPSWAEETQLHVWPTNNQTRGGSTLLLPLAEIKNQIADIDNIEQFQTINWHKEQLGKKTQTSVVIWNTGSSEENLNTLKSQFPSAIVLRYVGNHFSMMQKSLRNCDLESFWVISDSVDYENFDFLWQPNWAEETQLHVWPTDNQSRGGDTFWVPRRALEEQIDQIDKLEEYNSISWHTNESLESVNKTAIVIWSRGGHDHLLEQHPSATVLRYVGDHFSMMQKTLRKTGNCNFWVLSDNIDYSAFNWSWTPNWAEETQLHVWPTNNQTRGGDTFWVPGKCLAKQIESIEKLEEYDSVSWHTRESLRLIKNTPVVIWSRGNHEHLLEQHPAATVLRYVGDHYSMMQKTLRNISASHFWVVSDFCDYSNFDFSWTPNWAEETQLHVWPTNSQTRGGDTFWVPRRALEEQIESLEKLEEYDSVSWHKQSIMRTVDNDIFVWDMSGHNDNVDRLKSQYPNCTVLRYHGTHFDMLKRTTAKSSTDFFWVLSSCCDYKKFNKNWQPDWEYKNQLHVWASGDQKFGDTLFVPKKQFEEQMDQINELDYFDSIRWHENGYPRLDWPVNYIESNDVYHTIKNHKFTSVYEYFVAPGSTLGSTVNESIWKKRRLIAYNNNGHVVLSPRDTIGGISDKILSYPYIQYHKCEKSTQKPQDIVFISYDEKDADLTWKKLKKRFPRAQRVHGVDGMLNAYQAAAQKSSTPWFFAVFGKTQLVDDFEFDYNPNYLDRQGNYVFYAYNPIIDHSYGNGGVILYNRNWLLNLDSMSHDIDITMTTDLYNIPVISCVNNIAVDEWTAWKTAFREAYKLKYYSDQHSNIQDEYHLHLWLTKTNTKYGKWSQLGAQSAVEYYNSLPEQHKKDLRINDREWLRNRFDDCVKTINHSFNFAVS